MKKLLIIMLVMSLLTAASAQRHVVYVNSYVPVYSGFGWGVGFPPYGYYPYGYYPYGYSPYGYSYYYKPSRLDNQIAGINHDYDQKIQSVRMDKKLSGKARRQEIRHLKTERDKAIDNAKINYHRQ